MIQSAQVASKFTLFTHHAKTFPDLVTALRNSMLRAGVFKDERTAEEQVVSVFDHRKEKTLEGKLDKFMDNATHYFTKSTNRELYKHVNILEYHDGEYIITNKISDANIREMINNMDETDAEEFSKFAQKHWNTTVKQFEDETEKTETKKHRKKAKMEI